MYLIQLTKDGQTYYLNEWRQLCTKASAKAYDAAQARRIADEVKRQYPGYAVLAIPKD